jgi:hypothetical protein
MMAKEFSCKPVPIYNLVQLSQEVLWGYLLLIKEVTKEGIYACLFTSYLGYD